MWQLSFLNPWTLWLGLAAAVPLLIHLLWRQKPRRLPFTAVWLLRSSRRTSLRRTRLRHLLLLLARMALVVLAAMLIGRPVLHRGAARAGEEGVDATPAVAIIVDDSMSMNCRVGEASWFDLARGRAVELAEAMPLDGAAAVLTTTRPVGKLTRERSETLRRLRGLRSTLRGASCWPALQEADRLLTATGAAPTAIYLFTDMTPSAWSGWEQRRLELSPHVNVQVVDCSRGERANAAVTALETGGRPVVRGAELELMARLLASGGTAERAVELSLDGMVRERRKVALAADSEETVSFRLALERTGHHRGRVSFVNPDVLAADDARTFTLDVTAEISVLCVEDTPESGPESPSYFLRLALDPWKGGGGGIFRVTRAATAELEEQSLAPFDVVALVAATGVSRAAWRRLDAYVAGGGGLACFAGPEANEAYRTPAALTVLAAEPLEEVAAPEDSPFSLRIVAPDHLLVEALGAARADVGRASFARCRRLRPVGDAREVLGFGPDLPGLVLREGQGRSAVFAGPADDRWGDLVLEPAFVPLLHELMLYLSRARLGSLRSYPVGTQVPITYEPSRWPTVVEVRPPGGPQAQRLLPGATPGRLTWWKTDQPGYYAIKFERHGETWQDGFAVNTVPEESDLQRVQFGRVMAAIDAGSVELVEEARFVSGAGTGVAGTRDLVLPAALTALALLVAEGFLANRFYGS